MSETAGTAPGSQSTSDVAREQGQQVKGTAKDAASNVGGTAAERGRDIKDQAQGHARNIAGNAQSQLKGHAQEETQRAGAALDTAGSQLRALAEGRVDEAGAFGDYIGQAADAVGRWADTINDRGFDGLLDDLRSLGRRRPGAFLLGALAAGVVTARFGRNLAQEMGNGSGGSQSELPSGTSTGTGRATSDESYYAEGGDRASQGVGTDERETIVGYATDDRAVVTPGSDRYAEETAGERPVAPPAAAPRDEDLEYRPIDVDEEGRSR